MKLAVIKYRVFKLIFLIIISFSLIYCQEKKEKENVKETAKVEEPSENERSKKAVPDYYTSGIPVYEKFEDFEPILNIQNDTTYVINFWATWCKPCIKELPHFKDLDSIYKDKKMKVVLVSLDFPKDVDTKLVSFVKENQIEDKVVVLLDGKYNDWIDKVSPEWSGAIPATYIFNQDSNDLFQGAFENTSELVEVIEPFL
ncbi:TlpA family protein disulfide reductase [Gramella sp. MT6]|uniref:TlpA disulfide reductase family protein n=1 Tax=Gramella sp. MT6 TaxID=2705471 RepID=UPI001C5DFC50|nr:TlpA disulfide reductase family protein [Gramella sp. MT6]QYA26118.1 TlpA family protein disulfide reductase [Gramella sp. MT6]